jgi:hypothetical protein
MLRFELVDYVQSAFATDNLVVGADLLDTCTYFHTDRTPLISNVYDTLLKFIDKTVKVQDLR